MTKHWTDSDTSFLLDLLNINTVTPMETGRVSDMARAQTLLADHASELGFGVEMFRPPSYRVLDDPALPHMVLERLTLMGSSSFLEAQPNLVLRVGRAPQSHTLMFNFHMDTVDGEVPVAADGHRITGRGVADSKGLGVAVLAGVRTALHTRPSLIEQLSILVQSVGGEEGGAMGFYGTKYLAHLGFTGRLNVVCEPSSFAWFDRTTASMTARIEVRGKGATDDAPEVGQNATILLAAIVDRFVRVVAPRVRALGGKMCIAGIDTGRMHNRVYGTGNLLLNFAYPSMDACIGIERLIEDEFHQSLVAFRAEYAEFHIAEATAGAAEAICSLTWLKRRLPVLANRDPTLEAFLRRCGLTRHEEGSPAIPFTCDAMWLGAEGVYSIVLGPGDLAENHAHSAGEFMRIGDLDRFADQVCSMVLGFASRPPVAN